MLSNSENIAQRVSDLIEKHRVEIGSRPKTTPVKWKGFSMSVNEAKMIIDVLEKEKLDYQKWMNNTQTGGEITKLAASGAGVAAMVTGAALCLFPPTAIAGAITLASGVAASQAGQMIGDGVSNIGTNANKQSIEQIDSYIDSLKNAIIALL